MKKATLTIRLNAITRDALERAARDDERKLSAKADLILIAWLKDNGYLK
jgi:hypothetical protein